MTQNLTKPKLRFGPRMSIVVSYEAGQRGKWVLMVNNMIDIHTHVIPKVDDGAQSMSDSKAMLSLYQESGFTTIVATPHFPFIVVPEYEEKLEAGYSATKKLSESSGIEVLRGREVRLTPEVEFEPGTLKASSLAGTHYVLVDFPSGSWPHYAEEVLFQLQTSGLIPVLAHPERYGWGSNHRRTPQDLVDRGVLLQVTLGSLVGAFGSLPRKIANELLDLGLVHFTATDAHSPGTRMRAAIKGVEWLQKYYGDEAVEKTLEVNPSALLDESELEPFIPTHYRKQWIGLNFRRLIHRIG